jgi:hypothetical protein
MSDPTHYHPKQEGLRLQNALFVYADDPNWALSVRRKWQQRTELNCMEHAKLSKEICILKMQMRAALRTRRRFLGGIKPGEEKLRFPDLHWCTLADFDLDNNTASAHGLTLVDVRIFMVETTVTPHPVLGEASGQIQQTRKQDFELGNNTASAYELTFSDLRIFMPQTTVTYPVPVDGPSGQVRQASLDPDNNTAGAHGLAPCDVSIFTPDTTVPRPLPADEPSGQVRQTRKQKGPAANTLHAVRAISAAIHLGKRGRGRALTLAREAAELAQTLGLAGADSLNPESSAMRDLAAAAIEGLLAADRE